MRRAAALLDPRVDRNAGAQRRRARPPRAAAARPRPRRAAASPRRTGAARAGDTPARASRPRRARCRIAASSTVGSSVPPVNGTRIRRRAGVRLPRPAAAARDERRAERERQRGERDDRGDHSRQPVPVGAVRDDADVDARQLAHHAREQRAAEDLAAPRLVGRADEDVGRAALARRRGAPWRRGRRPPPRGSARRGRRRAGAARRAASPPPRSAGRPGGRTQSASISRAEPLRRAPRAAHDPLRLRLRLDEREHALGDRLLAERLEHGRLRGAPRRPRRPRAARARAAPTSLSARKKFVERDLGALLRVDLARSQPLLQRLGREVDEHDLVGLVEDAVGERLAHADLGQLEDRVVEALEVLDVDGRDDVDARGEHLVDVLPALLVAHPGGVRVRELVDQRELRRARDAPRRRPSPPARAPPCCARSRGTTSSPSASAVVSGRSCGSR